MLITGSTLKFVKKNKEGIAIVIQNERFLGKLKYFPFMEFTRNKPEIQLHQRNYILKLISKVSLSAAKFIGTHRLMSN